MIGIPLLWKVYACVGGLALLTAGYGVWHYRVAHAAAQAALAKVELEKQDAIEKALAARNRIRDLCDRDPSGCVPDDWFRD